MPAVRHIHLGLAVSIIWERLVPVSVARSVTVIMVVLLKQVCPIHCIIRENH